MKGNCKHENTDYSHQEDEIFCSDCGVSLMRENEEDNTKLKPKEQHTQGEWIAKEDKSNSPLTGQWEITGSNGDKIAKTPNGDPYLSCSAEWHAKQEANAHLIASAPELLEALKDWRDSLEKGYTLSQTGKEYIDRLINKAEGKE